LAYAGVPAVLGQLADVLADLYCANSQYYPQLSAMLLLFYFSVAQLRRFRLARVR
jgi:hypothetical protein